ncbi:MAG: hypothetical protein MUC51_20165 [Anaerolineae bacterium]|nr:hypothetical protein [Anaerolineae bacterium]
MIAVYDQWDNPTAWVYLALHGVYRLLWVLKSRIFPNARYPDFASYKARSKLFLPFVF